MTRETEESVQGPDSFKSVWSGAKDEVIRLWDVALPELPVLRTVHFRPSARRPSTIAIIPYQTTRRHRDEEVSLEEDVKRFWEFFFRRREQAEWVRFELTSEVHGVSHEERRTKDLERVKEERDRLFIENEVLKSRVSEERRNAARGQREYDQLKGTLDKMLDQLNERARANDTLQGIVLARDAGHLCMQESYRGAVKHVHGDKVVVVFETEDDPLEQIYDRSQFMDGKVPQPGDRVEVFVHAARRGAEHARTDAATELLKDSEGPRKRRRNVITGPYHEF